LFPFLLESAAEKLPGGAKMLIELGHGLPGLGGHAAPPDHTVGAVAVAVQVYQAL
jgi:hypothetical protein